ncbi:hypothetical protein JW890_09425 [candidate division WOR-3 bacterium]|nr:hypothetical protein [candidate division WOR-3 bacterium]
MLILTFITLLASGQIFSVPFFYGAAIINEISSEQISDRDCLCENCTHECDKESCECSSCENCENCDSNEKGNHRSDERQSGRHSGNCDHDVHGCRGQSRCGRK